MRYSLALLCVLVSLLTITGCKSMQATNEREHPPLASQELISAVLAGKIETVESRLRAGKSVNAADKKECSLLQLAIIAQRNSVVDLLLQKGANPNYRDLWDNFTALDFAAYAKNPTAMKMLLDSKAKFSGRVKSEALHIAAGEGCLECVKLLVGSGANVNYKTDKTPGSTPLMEAIDKRHYDIARYLLEKGANPKARDALGNSLSDYVDPSDMETVKALLAQNR